MNNTSASSVYWIAVSTAILTGIFTWLVIGQGNAVLYEENQIMEHVQLGLLAIVSWIFWHSDWCEMDEVSATERRHFRVLALTAAILGLSFILREMSVKQTGIDWLIYIVDGFGFKIIMLSLWLPLLVVIGRRFRSYWIITKRVVTSRFFVFAMMAMLLLIGGGIFDKEILKPEHFRFYEEALEMNGYAWLLMSALMFRQDIMQAAQSQATVVADSDHELIGREMQPQ